MSKIRLHGIPFQEAHLLLPWRDKHVSFEAPMLLRKTPNSCMMQDCNWHCTFISGNTVTLTFPDVYSIYCNTLLHIIARLQPAGQMYRTWPLSLGHQTLEKTSIRTNIPHNFKFLQSKDQLRHLQVVPGQAGGGSFQKNKPIGVGHVAG